MNVEPTTEDSSTALGPDNQKPPPPIGDDYDQLVRELVFDKRAQPKDRTKTEEEIAQEEKEALEKAERARLRRMMGEEGEETDEEGQRKKRSRGGDDLDGDFIKGDEDEGWAGMGTGLTVAGAPQTSDDGEDDSEPTDPEQDAEDLESGSEDEDNDEDGSSSDESGEVEERSQESTTKPKGRLMTLTSSPRNPNELPFAFQCPSSHEEFLEILNGVDRADIGTVIERIRKLHHPSLGENNKFKLQVCPAVDQYLKSQLTQEVGFHLCPSRPHNIRLKRAATRTCSSRCYPTPLCRAQ
jgi:nucleolar protein 14